MEKKKKITLFSFIIAFIMLVSTGIVLLTNNNNNKIVKAAYNNQFNATWSTYFWSGSYRISSGSHVWYNPVIQKYCYDYNTTHYELDISTMTWQSYTWTGSQINFNPELIWTDGTYVYWSNNSNQAILDYSTHTSTSNSFNYSSIKGTYIWDYNGVIHYDSGSTHYVFDSSTQTWSSYSWPNNSQFSGQYVFKFNNIYYYANGTILRVLDSSTNVWTGLNYSGTGSVDIYGDSFWSVTYNNENYLLYSRGGISYLVDINTDFTFTSYVFDFGSNITATSLDGRSIYYIDGQAYFYTGSVQNVDGQTLKLTMSNQNNSGDSTPDAFTGSNIYIPFTPGIVVSTGAINGPQLSYGGSTNLIYYLDLQMSFGINQDEDYYITFTSNYLNNQSLVDIIHMLDISYNALTDFTFSSSDIGSSISFYLYDDNSYTDLGANSPFGSNSRVVSVTVTISQDFTDFSFIGCHMFSDYTQDNNMYSINNHVRYFDANNGYIDISIYSYTSIGSAVDMYSSRMYYFESALSEGSSYGDYISGYNQGYDEGYSDGERDGYSNGSTSGYNNGYQAGYTAASGEVGQTQYLSGYQAGYSDGANDANTYSFTALIGSVIDTPIRYFSSLFNFNLLGVNLLTFMLALLTLGFVIIIIKHII